MEVDLAGLEGRGQRLGVHPGQHQDAPVGGVLDDRGHEPVGAVRDRGRCHGPDGRHATACGTSRTGRPGRGHRGLHVGDRVDPPVEDRGGEDRIGAAIADRGDEVGRAGGATRRDDRHADPVGDGPQELGVEAGARAVAVDGGDQQFAGAQVHDPLGPGDRVEVGRLAAALHDDLPGGLGA